MKNERSSNYFRAMFAVAWKDLAAEMRSKELLSAMLVFASGDGSPNVSAS